MSFRVTRGVRDHLYQELAYHRSFQKYRSLLDAGDIADRGLLRDGICVKATANDNRSANTETARGAVQVLVLRGEGC